MGYRNADRCVGVGEAGDAWRSREIRRQKNDAYLKSRCNRYKININILIYYNIRVSGKAVQFTRGIFVLSVHIPVAERARSSDLLLFFRIMNRPKSTRYSNIFKIYLVEIILGIMLCGEHTNALLYIYIYTNVYLFIIPNDNHDLGEKIEIVNIQNVSYLPTSSTARANPR